MAKFVFAVAIVYILHSLTAGGLSRANEFENAFSAVPAHPSVEAVLESCHEDMIALCGDTAFRMDTLSACLRENEEILSSSCSAVQGDFRQRSAALREAMQPFRAAATEACLGDVASLCGDARTGHATCLRTNADKLSADCGKARETLRGAQRTARNLHRSN